MGNTSMNSTMAWPRCFVDCFEGMDCIAPIDIGLCSTSLFACEDMHKLCCSANFTELYGSYYESRDTRADRQSYPGTSLASNAGKYRIRKVLMMKYGP